MDDRDWKRLLERIRRAVRVHKLWSPGARLLVACSGGLDSTAALALLQQLAPSLGHTLVAAHVDHGLRADGPVDAQAVRALAESLGVAFVARTLALQGGSDLQARARKARYSALHEMARDHGCAHIVTAHHADDQAETLLLRLSRGCGVEALAGIRAKREDGVVRPLLGIRRAELFDCTQRLGLAWREDTSNEDRRHARNRLRHDVLPALEAARPRATEGLARTAANAAGHTEANAFFVQAWVDQHLQMADSGTAAVLPLDVLPRAFAPLGEALGAIAARLGRPAPGHGAIAQVCAWIATSSVPSAPGGRQCDLHGLRLVALGQVVRIEVTDVAHPPGPDYPGRRGC